MRHKHADLIHAWAEGAEIECREIDSGDEWTGYHEGSAPQWRDDFEYRIKPEKKPDVVRYLGFTDDQSCYISMRHEVVDHWPRQLKLTFSGETGELLSAEVLK